MTDRTTPTDGNRPVPILPRETALIAMAPRPNAERATAAFFDWLANRDTPREKRPAVRVTRAPHAGTLSHDDGGAG